MKTEIKIIAISVFFLIVFCLFGAASDAATINAASASYSDVSTAVSAANSGDTIVVPAGNATWENRLSISKGITLHGAGAGSTIITSNYEPTGYNDGYLIVYEPSNPALNEAFRITGFTFDLNNKCGGICLKNKTTVAINQIRIDHNSILNATNPSYSMRGIAISGTIYGVIDNNSFSGNKKCIDSYGRNADSWNNLTFSYGTADMMYYEDNTFAITDTPHSGGVGGRYCSRYNTYTTNMSKGLYPWYDMHGNQGVGKHWATMGAEIYGNKIIHGYAGSGVGMVDQRGGMGLVFYNYVESPLCASMKCREEYDDSLNPETNPQPQHVSDSYYWNNRCNGTTLVSVTVTQDTSDRSTPNDPPVLVENREFWNHNTSFDGTSGVGCGTLAARPATCTTGVGYWATDQDHSTLSTDNVGASPTTPISGTLYKCTSTNTWTEYYTPYTYPHPLRKPSALQNLRIINP